MSFFDKYLQPGRNARKPSPLMSVNKPVLGPPAPTMSVPKPPAQVQAVRPRTLPQSMPLSPTSYGNNVLKQPSGFFSKPQVVPKPQPQMSVAPPKTLESLRAQNAQKRVEMAKNQAPVNPAVTDVGKPITPKPTPSPELQTEALSGFAAPLDPMDPAAIGGSMMRPQLPKSTLTDELGSSPDTDGSETRRAPERSQFRDDASYQAALSKFQSTGNWASNQPGNSGSQAPSQLDALRKSYLDSLGLSPEEQQAQTELSGISGSAAQETAKARQEYADRIKAIQDQATLQPFLTGRQIQASGQLTNQLEALQASTEAQTMPLQSRLAALQAQRQMEQKRRETELGFAESDRKAQEVTPIEVGGRLVNPKTGQVVYEPPASVKGETFTLSPGQKVYDAKGNVIAQNDSASDKLTNVAPGSTVIDANGNVVYTAGAENKPLSGEAAKVYSIATTIKPEIEQVKQLLRGAGRLQISQILAGLNPAASRLIDQVADKVGRLRSGGAINKDEAQRFKEQILRAGDVLTGDTSSALNALDALAAEADSVANSVRPGSQNRVGPGDELDQMLDQLGFKGALSRAQKGSPELKTLKIGNRDVRVDASIALRLANAARDFKQATGQDLQVNQDFRTHEEQARLYKELSAKGARVAPPGQSFHEKGLAIDVTNWKEAEPFLRRHGLVNDLADDRGHFSWQETNRRA